MVGGTGLYLKWFTQGKPGTEQGSPELRASIENRLQEVGMILVHELLVLGFPNHDKHMCMAQHRLYDSGTQGPLSCQTPHYRNSLVLCCSLFRHGHLLNSSKALLCLKKKNGLRELDYLKQLGIMKPQRGGCFFVLLCH